MTDSRLQLETEWGESYSLTPQSKKCSKCKEIRPLSDFHKNPKGKYGLNEKCKHCRSVYEAASYKKLDADRLDKRYKRQKVNKLRRVYGITQAEYDVLFQAQGGVCAACGHEETLFNPVQNCFYPLSVDHDHKTGKVRGLLCRACNVAYGNLKEDPERIIKLLEYHQRVHREDEKLCP